jgi:hypothetical protein
METYIGENFRNLEDFNEKFRKQFAELILNNIKETVD